MGHWNSRDHQLGSLRPVEGRSRDRSQHQGCGHGRAQRRRLRSLSPPRLRRRSGFHRESERVGLRGEPARHGAGPLGAAGRSRLGLRGCLCALQGGLSSAALHDDDQVGARQPGRRDDGALHRRDRHQLLLQRAQGRDRRAGAEADLRQDRGRRTAPLQAVLRPDAPQPETRRPEPPAAAVDRLGPHRRERGRRAGLRLFRVERAGRRRLRPQALHRGLCPARLPALWPEPRAARHGHDPEGGRPEAAGLAQPGDDTRRPVVPAQPRQPSSRRERRASGPGRRTPSAPPRRPPA